MPRTLWTSAVDFTKVLGNHILSFGFMDVFNQINGGHYFTSTFQFQTTSTAGPDPQNPTSGTGNSLASFDLGVGSGTDQTGYTQFPATSKHQLGWYLQDDWKVTRKLTVNLGLRYEVQLAPTERHNAQEFFDFNAVNPISAAVGFNVPGALVFNSGKIADSTIRTIRTSRRVSASRGIRSRRSWSAVVTAFSSRRATTATDRTSATRKLPNGSRRSTAA